MTFYVLVVDGIVQKYPYTLTDMRRDNPNIGFAPIITDDVAAKYNTFPVENSPQPSFNSDTEYLVRATPVFNAGSWIERWEVEQYTSEELAARLMRWRQNATCTPFQGRMALADVELLAVVEAAVAQADNKTKIAWEYALLWQRTSPMIAAIAGALQLTDTQIDDLFKAAAQISA